MHLPYLVRFILIVVAVATVGTLTALWISDQLVAAEKRRAQVNWGRPPGDDWPDEPGQATIHFFNVAEVPYDPDADATWFMKKMTEDNVEFMLTMGSDKKRSSDVVPYRSNRPSQHRRRPYSGNHRSGHSLPISWARPRGAHRTQH